MEGHGAKCLKSIRSTLENETLQKCIFYIGNNFSVQMANVDINFMFNDSKWEIVSVKK